MSSLIFVAVPLLAAVAVGLLRSAHLGLRPSRSRRPLHVAGGPAPAAASGVPGHPAASLASGGRAATHRAAAGHACVAGAGRA
jgi:hypothetical protein